MAGSSGAKARTYSAWFAASVATVGGSLGALIESREAVRAAAYWPRARSRARD